MADYDPFFPVFSPHHTGTSRDAGIRKSSQNPDDWTLYEATLRERLDVVQRILTSPVNHDLQQIAGALRLTGQCGLIDIARYILWRTKITVDAHCPDGYTALVLAARQGHDDMVQMLIEHGANPCRTVYRTKVSALHWAAVNGHVRCVELLLKAGAKPEALTLQQRTPLMLAACYGQDDIVSLLVKVTGSISHKDLNGVTALHMAVMEGHVNCSKILIYNNADMDAQNLRGYTPLMMAIERAESEAACCLIRSGSNLEIEIPSCKIRAIHLATSLQRSDIVERLILEECSLEAKCASVQACNDLSTLINATPLHIAATGSDVPIFRLIVNKLKYHTSVDTLLFLSAISNGLSPLMLAAAFGSVEIIIEYLNFLKEEILDIEILNEEISLAITVAALQGRHDALITLLQNSTGTLPEPPFSEIMMPWASTNFTKSCLNSMLIESFLHLGRLNSGVVEILADSGNCDRILESLPDMLSATIAAPSIAALIDDVIEIKRRRKLEHLCIATIRKFISPRCKTSEIYESLPLPRLLINQITLK